MPLLGGSDFNVARFFSKEEWRITSPAKNHDNALDILNTEFWRLLLVTPRVMVNATTLSIFFNYFEALRQLTFLHSAHLVIFVWIMSIGFLVQS